MSPIYYHESKPRDVSAGELAEYMAHQPNDYQAEFFNVFWPALRGACESEFGFGTQLLWILKELDPEAESAFALLARETDEAPA